MDLRIAGTRRIATQLGSTATRFIESAASGITRVLPHVETVDWSIGNFAPTRLRWANSERKQLFVVIGINAGDRYSISCTVQRRSLPTGVGSIQRTLAPREREICQVLADRLTGVFDSGAPRKETLEALGGVFDELVVADHLKRHHNFALDPERIFRAFRGLAEQTYENKALTFGCIIDASDAAIPEDEFEFPEALLSEKRFRAMSDAYYTTYEVSSAGRLSSFRELPPEPAAAGNAYFPEWARRLASECHGSRVGFALTRHGDILVLDGGSLRFTYRFGRWQYWNHRHLVDLLRNAARVQHVPMEIVPRVAGALYRAALDVSFRRSGGLFVVLRNRQNLGKIVRGPDQIGHSRRTPLNREFDEALTSQNILSLSRSVLVELSALDGAVVVDNQGHLLSYGAVLTPKAKGRADAAEGSRTKAAIGASNYGLAVKISADGDITVFLRGREFIKV